MRRPSDWLVQRSEHFGCAASYRHSSFADAFAARCGTALQYGVLGDLRAPDEHSKSPSRRFSLMALYLICQDNAHVDAP